MLICNKNGILLLPQMLRMKEFACYILKEVIHSSIYLALWQNGIEKEKEMFEIEMNEELWIIHEADSEKIIIMN